MNRSFGVLRVGASFRGPNDFLAPLYCIRARAASSDRGVQEVRNDSSSTNWTLLGYNDAKAIVLDGKGTGGHAELVARLQPEKVQYGLLRVSDVIDGHSTVKFVFVQWVGEKVKATFRALTATHKGEITDLIGAHHVSLYGCVRLLPAACPPLPHSLPRPSPSQPAPAPHSLPPSSTASEVSEATIMASVTKASGTSNKVLDSDNRPAQLTASAGTGAAKREHGAAGSGAFEVAGDVEAALKELRKDTSADDWALLAYK